MVRRNAARSIALMLTLCTAFVVGCAVSAPGPEISLETVNSHRAVAVTRLSPQTLDAFDALDDPHRQQVLRLFVADAPTGAPSVSGIVTRRGGQLVFSPRYPFEPGVSYRAEFQASLLSPGQPTVLSQLSIPAPPSQAVTRVEAIYPSGDELPENLLRFYIYFSGPMNLGEAYRRVRLVDDKGQTVARPFLELEEELWNPQMTRFTLLFDPGRIKHGLVSQMELGPALVAGRTYKLVVDAGWHDAQNRPLAQPTSKTFRTTPAQRGRPDPAQWKITLPHHDSTEPLVVVFDRPMDYPMLQRVISVRELAGTSVSGTITISDHERKWSFTPRSSWQQGNYHLAVQTILEDPAGNSVRKEFEVDLNAPAPADAPDDLKIPFQVP
jgi:hypothetical protein